jgi:hypothetical protein
MAKAFLCYVDDTYRGPVGDQMTACIVVAADSAAAKVAAAALNDGDIAAMWSTDATVVDLDTTFTAGEFRFKLLKPPTALS